MNIYHMIDHEGFGTIHRLLIPLCETFPNHNLYTTGAEYAPLTPSAIDLICQDPDAYIILHSTGKMKTNFITNFRKLFSMTPAAFFLHTSYRYQELKDRGDMIHDLLRLTKEYQMQVFLPSKEVAEQYGILGVPVQTVQLGIPSVCTQEKYLETRPDLEPYYNKIITTCCSEQPVYQYVKGIDLFEGIISDLHLEHQALIAGINGDSRTGIPMKKFSTDDFLNILSHAAAYVQLSRFETYNLTAVQAKQFQIPVLALGVEGVHSCMGPYVCDSVNDLKNKLELVLSHKPDTNILQECLFDSLNRESLYSFCQSLEAACASSTE